MEETKDKGNEETKELTKLNKLYSRFKFESNTKYWIDYSQVINVVKNHRRRLRRRTGQRCRLQKVWRSSHTSGTEWH